jgi:fibronectin type 3 domain-containing protein
VILRWSAVLNANSYNIYAGDSVGFVVGPSTYVGTTENTAYTHTGVVLAANMKFYVVLASSSLPGAVVIPPAENRRDR